MLLVALLVIIIIIDIFGSCQFLINYLPYIQINYSGFLVICIYCKMLVSYGLQLYTNNVYECWSDRVPLPEDLGTIDVHACNSALIQVS